MSFTDEELAYIRSQPLARVATVSSDGQPDIVTVELVERTTRFGAQTVMKITPAISWSINLSGRPLAGRQGEDLGQRTVHKAS